MAGAKKAKLTLAVENFTREAVMETIHNGEQINMMRDYWYKFKKTKENDYFRAEDDYKRTTTKVATGQYKGELGKAHTDGSWSDKISNIIRSTIEEMAYSSPSIYSSLGLESDILISGEAPIVVVFEKELKQALPIVRKHRAGYAFNEGQMPTEEVAHLCGYLDGTKYRKGYIFVVADYDPAGDSLYNSVKLKVELFSTRTKIEVIRVPFNTVWNYNPCRFASYTLSDNKTNKSWISEGKITGIEYNDPDNVECTLLRIESCMEKEIDPRIYASISHESWRSNYKYKLGADDEYYQKLQKDLSEVSRELKKKIEWRETRHEEIVAKTSTFFFSHGNSFATIRIEKAGLVLYEDAKYIRELLEHNNPYTAEYKHQLLQVIADTRKYIDLKYQKN